MRLRQLPNLHELTIRAFHELGTEKPIRCFCAKLDISPSLYNCQYGGDCDNKQPFGETRVYCKKELYR